MIPFSRMRDRWLPAVLAATMVAAAACAGAGGGEERIQRLPVQPVDPDEIPDFSQFDEGDLPDDVKVTRPIPGTAVALFPARDDTDLTGRVFGENSRRGVVLMHPSDADQEYWYDLAQRFMDAGIIALPFDFRGYNQSGGERDPAGYPSDVHGAVEFLERQMGARSVAVVGAEVGGTAAVAAAGSVTRRIRVVVTVGSGAVFDNLNATQDARRIDIDALMISAGDDGSKELANLIRGAGYRDLRGADQSAVEDEIFTFVRDNL